MQAANKNDPLSTSPASPDKSVRAREGGRSLAGSSRRGADLCIQEAEPEHAASFSGGSPGCRWFHCDHLTWATEDEHYSKHLGGGDMRESLRAKAELNKNLL